MNEPWTELREFVDSETSRDQTMLTISVDQHIRIADRFAQTLSFILTIHGEKTATC
nr:hypothetical protein [Paraburkholderia tropica]